MPFIEIKIPTFDVNDLPRRVRKALNRQGRHNENILLRTTQYFETVRPTFTSELERTSDGWQTITGPIDDSNGQIWSFLDQGTDVRYAWMDEGYAAGTTPGTFVTQPTAGQRVGFSIQEPAEGIEARGWTELLADEQLEPFAGRIRDELGDWLNKWAGKASRIISG